MDSKVLTLLGLLALCAFFATIVLVARRRLVKRGVWAQPPQQPAGVVAARTAFARPPEAAVAEVLREALPQHSQDYIQSVPADGSDIDRVLGLWPTDTDERVKLLATQIAQLKVELVDLSHSHRDSVGPSLTDHKKRLGDLEGDRMTPERVTVIASGMAVGLVLLLFSFTALVLGFIKVLSPVKTQDTTTQSFAADVQNCKPRTKRGKVVVVKGQMQWLCQSAHPTK